MSSTSTVRRSKRQRSDDSVSVSVIDAEPTPAVTRSEYWLDDGNIVLQAENVQFRVHRSVLARQSGVFKDMFGMPQPLQSEEPTVDGCPVVCLSDAADDVEAVLAIFYDNVKALNLTEYIPIEQVGAMIRLGSKYEIEDLKERGLEIMHNDNPTKLQDWDNLNSDIKYDRCGVVVRKILEIVYDYSLESAKPMAFFSVLVEVSLKGLLAELRKPHRHAELYEDCVLGRDRLLSGGIVLEESCLRTCAGRTSTRNAKDPSFARWKDLVY